LPSIFKQGTPDILNQYISLIKDNKHKLSQVEETIGSGVPLNGGMIAEPDYHVLKDLENLTRQHL